jgi:hypothetical protein
MQHATRMRCIYIVICELSGAYEIYPHYLINGTIFGKKVTTQKRVSCISLQLLSEAFLFVRRIHHDNAINVYTSPCKASVILFGF